MKKITKGMLELVELSDKFKKKKKELPTVYELSEEGFLRNSSMNLRTHFFRNFRMSIWEKSFLKKCRMRVSVFGMNQKTLLLTS